MKSIETPSPLGVFDRLLPHDIAAEMCVLGSMLADREMTAEVQAVLSADAFFQVDHQIIFKVIGELSKRGAVDAMLLRAEMEKRDVLAECGGIQYLAEIVGCQPSAAHGVYYAKIVAEKFRQREIISACNDAIRAAYTPHAGDPSETICARLEAAMASIRDRGTKDTIRRLDEILQTAIESRLAGKVAQMRFGLTELDELCGGMPIGGFTIIAGAAGMGKSALTKQIALNAARAGVKVGIIAVEESCDKIAANYLANASGVESSKIMYNRLHADELQRICGAPKHLPGEFIFVDDAQQKMSSIETTARRLVKRHGCGMLIVDHIHIIDGESEGNRTQEIGEISLGLKNLFKNLGVAGIGAAQVNRGWKKGEAPSLDYMRDSGSLGADADLALMLYRDDYFRWKEDPKNFVADHELKVYVVKNKAGGEGMVTTTFIGDTQSVTDRVDPFA